MKNSDFLFDEDIYLKRNPKILEESIEFLTQENIQALNDGVPPQTAVLIVAKGIGNGISESPDVEHGIQYLLALTAHLYVHLAKMKAHGKN